jgi:hypothetical protein
MVMPTNKEPPINLDAIIEAGKRAKERPWTYCAKALGIIGADVWDQHILSNEYGILTVECEANWRYAMLAANHADQLAAMVKERDAKITRVREYAARLSAIDGLRKGKEVAAVIERILEGGE